MGDPSQITDLRLYVAADPDGLCANVFVRDTSFAVKLPSSGTVLVGRGENADIRLTLGSVSRSHAIFEVGDNGRRVTVRDAGSRNGTFANGEQVASPRVVAHGDEIVVGDVRIVLLRGTALPVGTPAFMTSQAFVGQVAREIESSATLERPLYVVAVQLPAQWIEMRALRDAIEGMPKVGVFGMYSDTVLAIAMPSAREDEALGTAGLVGKRLDAVGIRAHVGVAAYTRGLGAQDLIDAALHSATRGRADTIQDEPLVADSAMRRLYDHALQVAKSGIAILLVGETGVGKEVLAQAIHRASARPGPLVSVNSAALPEALLESELFGHERGAFSGANQTKVGLIEAAQRGTLFLDEIGELPMQMQAKLLRVLETKMLRRVGSTAERPLDVRFVSATNADLEHAVAERRFRQDLLFRLNACTIRIPPLRERVAEIPRLASHFLKLTSEAYGVPSPKISTAALKHLEAYAWPGNIRELRNVVERAAAICQTGVIGPDHLPESLFAGPAVPQSVGGRTMQPPGAPSSLPRPPPLPSSRPPAPQAPAADNASVRESVRGLERERIMQALTQTGWNQTRAAELLGLPRKTLSYKMARLGIRAKEGQ